MSFFSDIGNAVSSVVSDVAKLAEIAAPLIFPELSIAAGLTNLAAGALGGGIGDAVDMATKELGMPKFLGDQIKNIVSGVLKQFTQSCDPACSDMLNDKVGDKFKSFEKQLMSDISDTFQKYKSDEDKKAGEGSGTSKSGKSWFVAFMEAMGKIENQQTDKLQKLQKEVSDSLGAGDGSASSQQSQFDKMEEFKAEGQLMQAITSMVSQIGKALGDALQAASRAPQ